jgi:lysophospholipase L1-like esterase
MEGSDMRRKFALVLVVALSALAGLTRGTAATPGRVQPAGASSVPSLQYVALGDSITNAGYLDESERYANMYEASLSTDLGVPVTLSNLGIGGLFSNQLLDRLKNDPTFRSAVRDANVITVMIGTNDFSYAGSLYLGSYCGGDDNQDCLRSARYWLNVNLTNIVAEIKSLNQRSGTQILLADFYDIPSGNQAVLTPYVNEMSSDIHDVAAANNLGVANVHQAFNGADGTEDPNAKGYKWMDGFHPNAQGQAEIAGLFMAFNGALLDMDTDGDGFTNRAELYLGTNLLASCPADASDAAFPPDLNNSGKVDVRDVMMAMGWFGKSAASREWATKYRRLDSTEDGKIAIGDFVRMLRNYGKSYC